MSLKIPNNPVLEPPDPGESGILNKLMLGITISIVIILLGAILAYAFRELGSQDKRIGDLEIQEGVLTEKIDSLNKLVDERTRTLERKLDDLHRLIKEERR